MHNSLDDYRNMQNDAGLAFDENLPYSTCNAIMGTTQDCPQHVRAYHHVQRIVTPIARSRGRLATRAAMAATSGALPAEYAAPSQPELEAWRQRVFKLAFGINRRSPFARPCWPSA
jgi:hypothetical protein